MECFRCHGLMISTTLEDAGGSSCALRAWHCLLCGDVVDSCIAANASTIENRVALNHDCKVT